MYSSIQTRYAAQSQLLRTVLDRMAAMEQEVLAFLDPVTSLQYDYGASPPDSLPGAFPVILHLPERQTMSMASIMMGDNLSQHPGGRRVHTVQLVIQIILASREVRLEKLIAETTFWPLAFDMAYARNGSLGGACQGTKILAAEWGTMPWSGATLWGWKLHTQVRLEYQMEGEG